MAKFSLPPGVSGSVLMQLLEDGINHAIAEASREVTVEGVQIRRTNSAGGGAALVLIDRAKRLNDPATKVVVLNNLRKYFPDNIMSRLAAHSLYVTPY